MGRGGGGRREANVRRKIQKKLKSLHSIKRSGLSINVGSSGGGTHFERDGSGNYRNRMRKSITFKGEAWGGPLLGRMRGKKERKRYGME